METIDLESSRFLVAASNAATSFDIPVPSCPGWDMADLVEHLGFVHWRSGLVVFERRLQAPDKSELPPAPEGAALVGWFAERRMALLAALNAADAETLVWNWTPNSPGPTSFWFRRIAHETMIHRVDIELAQGLQPTGGDPEVSADTVAEFFELFHQRLETKFREASLTGSLHLHATDLAGAEWTLEPSLSGFPVTREHSKADVALRGNAFDLACWTWGRLPTDRLDVFGDRQIAESFQQLLSS